MRYPVGRIRCALRGVSRRLPSPLFLICIVLLSGGCSAAQVSIRESSVDERSFLDEKIHPIGIYGSSPRRAFHPVFSISFAGFDRWIFTRIADDEHYDGIALLVDRSEESESPYLVLYPRVGEGVGRGEAYTSGDVETARRVLGSAVYDLYESRDLEFRYVMNEEVLLVEARMTDRFGREIYLGLKEEPLPARRYSVLLPVPEGTADPRALLLLNAHGFFFNTVKNTRFRIRIGGETRRIVKHRGKVEGVRVYDSRYSTNLLPVVWNEEIDDVVEPVSLRANARQAELAFGDVTNRYAIQHNYGYLEILSVTADYRGHRVRFAFSPAIPEIASLADGVDVSGSFSFSVDENTGIMAGEYSLHRRADRIEMSVQPTRGDPPIGGEPWVDRYRWNARMELLPGNRLRVFSDWRIERENFEIDLDD